jgi:hypothetical protein
VIRENKEHWKHLCKRAAVEPDPERLMALIEEINYAAFEPRAEIPSAAEGPQNLVAAVGLEPTTYGL